MDESEIPIDIHTNKLLDWLISRRHVPRDWSKRVVTVREKINEAIKDMPEDEGITALLSGSYINYYHCQKIIEILKETEASSKNMFGQYSSKRMKDWVEIVKLYEKDNIYLGEVASLLQRNVNYEVPALKKQITRTINLRNDYDKKESNYEKLADSIKKDFNANCKALGISGVKIKQELIKKAAEFPKMCEETAVEMKGLKVAVDFYEHVVVSLLDTKKNVFMNALRYIIENGNTTVYQWKYKKVPTSVELATLSAFEEEEEEGLGENDDVIDFGIDLDDNADGDIDWGISTEESEPTPTANERVNDKTVARGEEALNILSHLDTRNCVINDILELEAFLKVRLHEMNSELDDLGLTLLPESLQMYDIKAIQEMLRKVQAVLSNLTNPTSLHYLNIITNQKYVDQLAEKLKQKLSSHDKMLASRDWVRNQKEEIFNEGEALKPKVELLIQKSKDLQELIEQDISKRYKGRPVNLIAGANIL